VSPESMGKLALAPIEIKDVSAIFILNILKGEKT
jgi:hypothetical protein